MFFWCPLGGLCVLCTRRVVLIDSKSCLWACLQAGFSGNWYMEQWLLKHAKGFVGFCLFLMGHYWLDHLFSDLPGFGFRLALVLGHKLLYELCSSSEEWSCGDFFVGDRRRALVVLFGTQISVSVSFAVGLAVHKNEFVTVLAFQCAGHRGYAGHKFYFHNFSFLFLFVY